MPQANKELWRPIPEWEHYEVSTHGRIRNSRGRILKPHTHYGNDKRLPYLRVGLTKPNATISGTNLKIGTYRHNMRVHRAVALAFVPNPEDKPEVDHIDADTKNNHVSNLDWVTSQENIQRRYDRAAKGGCCGG